MIGVFLPMARMFWQRLADTVCIQKFRMEFSTFARIVKDETLVAYPRSWISLYFRTPSPDGLLSLFAQQSVVLSGGPHNRVVPHRRPACGAVSPVLSKLSTADQGHPVRRAARAGSLPAVFFDFALQKRTTHVQ
jgi:hypothetical protein